MNSISFQKPIAQGQQLDWTIGHVGDDGYWKNNYGGNENMMAVIERALEMSDLDGFTLFKVKAGYQLSTRVKSEDGWIVRIIPEEQAQAVFAMLETDSRFAGSGIDYARAEREAAVMREAEEAVRALTAAVEACIAALGTP